MAKNKQSTVVSNCNVGRDHHVDSISLDDFNITQNRT